MKHFTTLSLLILFSTQILAQFNHSIGLKANDNYGGLNYKIFVLNNNALDLTLHSNLNLDFGLSALFEHHQDFGRRYRAVSWYYGGGVHAGKSKMSHDKKLDVGVDAVLGMGYLAQSLPLGFSLDYLPGYSKDFSGGHFEYCNWSVAVRYIIN